MKYKESRDAFYGMILEKMDDIQVIEATSPENSHALYILPEDVYIIEVESIENSVITNNNYKIGDILLLRKAQTNFLYSIVKIKYIADVEAHFEVIDAFEPAILLEELTQLSEGDITY